MLFRSLHLRALHARRAFGWPADPAPGADAGAAPTPTPEPAPAPATNGGDTTTTAVPTVDNSGLGY